MTPLLRVPCEHGKWDAHGFDSEFCHGGREPTVEETTQWLATKGLEVHEAMNLRALLAKWGIPD